jgi:hypothetical protein
MSHVELLRTTSWIPQGEPFDDLSACNAQAGGWPGYEEPSHSIPPYLLPLYLPAIGTACLPQAWSASKITLLTGKDQSRIKNRKKERLASS